jgi:hypothetical protein
LYENRPTVLGPVVREPDAKNGAGKTIGGWAIIFSNADEGKVSRKSRGAGGRSNNLQKHNTCLILQLLPLLKTLSGTSSKIIYQ